MRKAFALIRILLWLELAGRLELLMERAEVRGFRLFARSRSRWPDFDDYSRAALAHRQAGPSAGRES